MAAILAIFKVPWMIYAGKKGQAHSGLSAIAKPWLLYFCSDLGGLP
jgi:hypothetical protein